MTCPSARACKFWDLAMWDTFFMYLWVLCIIVCRSRCVVQLQMLWVKINMKPKQSKVKGKKKNQNNALFWLALSPPCLLCGTLCNGMIIANCPPCPWVRSAACARSWVTITCHKRICKINICNGRTTYRAMCSMAFVVKNGALFLTSSLQQYLQVS